MFPPSTVLVPHEDSIMAPGPCFPPEFPMRRVWGNLKSSIIIKKNTFNFMKISNGLLHKQFNFVLNSQKNFTFYWIWNLKGGNANIAKTVFSIELNLLSVSCQIQKRQHGFGRTWVSVGKLGHSIWRKESADRFTSGRVQVSSKKWKYYRYKQRFIHTSKQDSMMV